MSGRSLLPLSPPLLILRCQLFNEGVVPMIRGRRGRRRRTLSTLNGTRRGAEKAGLPHGEKGSGFMAIAIRYPVA